MKKNTSKKSCDNNAVIITAIVSAVIIIGFGLLFYITQRDINKGLVTENDLIMINKTQGNKPEPQALPIISVRIDEDMGQILTASNGMTLYVNSDDEKGLSNCDEECRSDWVPFVSEGELTPNLEATGTLMMIADTKQITYGGQPLYFWASDNAPGDANGEGEKWSVAKP